MMDDMRIWATWLHNLLVFSGSAHVRSCIYLFHLMMGYFGVHLTQFVKESSKCAGPEVSRSGTVSVSGLSDMPGVVSQKVSSSPLQIAWPCSRPSRGLR